MAGLAESLGSLVLKRAIDQFYSFAQVYTDGGLPINFMRMGKGIDFISEGAIMPTSF